MPLEINGYNGAFKPFVKFPEHGTNRDPAAAVANAAIPKSNQGGKTHTTVVGANKTSFSWMPRTRDDKTANVRTRELFRRAMGDMFGGATKSPPLVFKAK